MDDASLPAALRVLSRCRCFHRRLIHWLTRGRRLGGVGLWDEGGLTGSLTSHFLEANPPVTMTLDQRLIVPAAGRRALRVLAALHRSTGVGALSGPNRESSLSPASWLLHPQGVILCLAAYLL